ncbi:O-methyltransferase glim [Elsinoe ampelina]|uniref:O-methyltransferase glim n=1 Tax=Elsinoe ampelina TaxID=302913 RepID=A0A6A6G148_9PEZI|nr:O-methyltransferase glim [Elsinoe ampelina]
MANDAATLARLSAHLETLKRDAENVRDSLQSIDTSQTVYRALHDPDRLPNKDFESLCSSVVNSLEQVSQALVPSVSLLTDVFFGYLQTKALWTLVKNNVPDHLCIDSGLSLPDLASRSSIQPDRLSQLMDMMINQGVFTFDEVAQVYRNNRASELLQKDHWTQWHLWSDLYGTDFYDVCRAMPEAVSVGERRSAAQIAWGTEKGLFDYMAEVGLLDKFHRTLGAGAVAQSMALAVDYPFDDIANESFIDIGGGSGDFLAAILRKQPNMTAGMLDLPSVIERAEAEFLKPNSAYADIRDRLTAGFHAGDFFQQVPASKVYTMKWCLHDWSDEDVIRIFTTIRRDIVASPLSRLLVFESVKEPGRSSRLPRYGDLIMMITVNGQERSARSWRDLAEKSGWRVDAIHPIRRAWPCAIDLRPV